MQSYQDAKRIVSLDYSRGKLISVSFIYTHQITDLIQTSNVAKMESLLYDGHHKFNVLDDKGQPALSSKSEDKEQHVLSSKSDDKGQSALSSKSNDKGQHVLSRRSDDKR